MAEVLVITRCPIGINRLGPARCAQGSVVESLVSLDILARAEQEVPEID